MELPALWDIGLTAAAGFGLWWVKSQHEELKRIQILLNRTREEVVRDYVTKADNNAAMIRVCLESLWTRESRFDNYAKNQRGSSAYGIAQLLGEKDHRSEYQILRGLKYISKRHHTPCRAYRFWLKHNYY